MKKSIQIMALFLCASMLFGGCGKKEGSSEKKSSNKSETSEKNTSGKLKADMEKEYPETRLAATPLETEIKNIPDAACEISEVEISEVVQDDFEHVEIHKGPYYAGKDLTVKLNLASSTGKSEFTAYLFPSGSNYSYDLEDALVSPVEFISVENSKNAECKVHIPCDFSGGADLIVTNGDEVCVFAPMFVHPEERLGDVQVDKPVIYLYPQEDMEVYVTLDLEGELRGTYPRYVRGKKSDMGEISTHSVGGHSWTVKPIFGNILPGIENADDYSAMFWTGEVIKPNPYRMYQWAGVAGLPEYHESDEEGWHVIAHPDGSMTNLADGRNYDYLFWEGTMGPELADFSNAACVAGEDTVAFLENYLTTAGLNDSEIDDFISYWLPQMEGNAYNLIAFPTEVYAEKAKLNVYPKPDSELRVFMVFQALDEPTDSEITMPEPFERKGFTVVEWGGCEIEK